MDLVKETLFLFSNYYNNDVVLIIVIRYDRLHPDREGLCVQLSVTGKSYRLHVVQVTSLLVYRHDSLKVGCNVTVLKL